MFLNLKKKYTGGKSGIIQKEQEYPNIKWDKLEDTDVQKAVILYNDRVNSYHKMKDIDAVIDSEPTTKRVMDLADLRNRNLLAFKELKSFNDSGVWLNKHPLLEQHSIRYQLRDLLTRKPDEFLDEFTKTTGYVSRYKSYLNNKNRSEEEHANDKKNLGKHSEKEQIMRELLNESR